MSRTAPLPASTGDGAPAREDGPQAARRRRRGRVRAGWIFALLLGAGVGLRLWRLGVSPAWQWDESVYYRVAVNVQHGLLTEHPLWGTPWTPFLYQPPFHMLLVARWFDLVGASIYDARILGVLLTAVMLAVLFRLLWKIHGPGVALFAIVPVVFDGWLMYIERVSYIENALMVIIVTGFLLYQRALERPSWQRFAVAGLVIGSAAVYKQTGAYVLLATLLCWLIVRRAHSGHFVLLASALAVITVYIIAMTRMYDVPGHDWFTSQSLVQIRRVLGLQQSGGTLTSPAKLLHLLAAQYGVFIPSLLCAFIAFLIALRRLLQCYRARDWAPARPNALLFSWLATGVVVFGFSSLKFPQYFVLILVPAYCYLWTELARWDWRGLWKAAAAAAVTVAGLASFALTVPAFSVNTLAQTQQYAAAHIPPNAVVVTEQSVGDLIQQPWCAVEQAVPCLHAATYAITWRTYLQSSFQQGDRAFHRIMQGALPIASFRGAVGTATVWRLRK